jgi:hypothetical protein
MKNDKIQNKITIISVVMVIVILLPILSFAAISFNYGSISFSDGKVTISDITVSSSVYDEPANQTVSLSVYDEKDNLLSISPIETVTNAVYSSVYNGEYYYNLPDIEFDYVSFSNSYTIDGSIDSTGDQDTTVLTLDPIPADILNIKVVDSDGEIITDGVYGWLYWYDQEENLGVINFNNGYVTIPALSDGEYEIYCNHPDQMFGWADFTVENGIVVKYNYDVFNGIDAEVVLPDIFISGKVFAPDGTTEKLGNLDFLGTSPDRWSQGTGYYETGPINISNRITYFYMQPRTDDISSYAPSKYKTIFFEDEVPYLGDENGVFVHNPENSIDFTLNEIMFTGSTQNNSGENSNDQGYSSSMYRPNILLMDKSENILYFSQSEYYSGKDFFSFGGLEDATYYLIAQHRWWWDNVSYYQQKPIYYPSKLEKIEISNGELVRETPLVLTLNDTAQAPELNSLSINNNDAVISGESLSLELPASTQPGNLNVDFSFTGSYLTMNGMIYESGEAIPFVDTDSNGNWDSVEIIVYSVDETYKTYALSITVPNPTPTPEADDDPVQSQPNTPVPTPTPTPTPTPVIEKDGDGDVRINISSETTEENNKKTSEAELDKSTLEEAFNRAETNKGTTRSVDVVFDATEDADSYRLNLQSDSFDADGSAGSDNVTDIINMKTPIATLSIPDNMFTTEQIGDTGTISLSVAAVDKDELNGISDETREMIGNKPIVELSALKDGEKFDWSNPSAPVKVSIPYTPTDSETANPELLEKLSIWYIDGNGNIIEVPDAVYDSATGMISFNATHFSNYAVVRNDKTFIDLSGFGWAEKAINVLGSRGVVKGTNTERTIYNPEAKVKRADFMIMLIRALGLSASFEGNFSDVSDNSYYYDDIGIAKELEIVLGYGNNLFSPEQYISREEMMQMLFNTLKATGKNLNNPNSDVLATYTDVDDISGYALEAVEMMVFNKIVLGKTSTTINPGDLSTRAEAAVIIYRFLNVLLD